MTDAAEAKKNRLISELGETRKTILEVASALSPAEQDEVFLGIWSVKDLLAHLIGWDFTNIEAVREILAGELPGFYSHHDPDWKTYNARLVAQYKRDDFADLLSSVEDSQKRLLDFLGTIPASEFGKDRGLRFRGYKVTIQSLLQAEINDERVHHTQVQHFAGRHSLTS